MKVGMVVLGSPSLIGLVVFMDVKHRIYLPGFCTELRSCVKVGVVVLGSPP